MKKSTIKKVGKLRKQQDLVKCPECDMFCKTGGLVNHVRLLHHMVYEKIPKAVDRIPISKEMIDSVNEKEIDRLDGTAAKQISTLSDYLMKPMSKYTEAIIYYRRNPQLAIAKWNEMQNNKFAWSIYPDLMLALQRLCNPKEDDLYHIKSMGKENYWDA